jgi:hypothetical protein
MNVRAALFAACAALTTTHAGAQALVQDLAGFKAIPVPQGVRCLDGPSERECEFRHTADGKEYTFFAAFLEKPAGGGETRRAFVVGVSPYSAAKLAEMERLYKHYAMVLALHDTQALVTAVPSLAEMPELCAKSPSATRKTGEECLLIAGECLVRTTPGDSDQSGLVFTRQWAVK